MAGTVPIAEAERVLSSVYAVDMFLGNWDRHVDNFVIEPDGSTVPRIRVIDFSEAPALLDPGSRLTVSAQQTATVQTGRVLRARYGFSEAAASLALGRLEALPPTHLKGILDEMPADWLSATIRSEFAAWWLSPARAARIATVKSGLSNGTFL
jgi:hypothetical protein